MKIFRLTENVLIFSFFKLGDLIGKKYNGPFSIPFFTSPFLSNFVQSNSLRNAYFLPDFGQSRLGVHDQLPLSNFVLRPGTVEHRRYIYSSEQYVLPCGNGITARRRESNPDFYRANPSCIHRLMPFLSIELRALIHDTNERTIVMRIIHSSLTVVKINSTGFQQLISQYFLSRTVHFIHEFYNFAISVFDASRYFEEAIYLPRVESNVVQIEHHLTQNNASERNLRDNEHDNDNDDDLFDLADPYNFRSQRRIVYNLVNNSNNLPPFRLPDPQNLKRLRATFKNRNNLAEVSDDSDIEIVYEESRLENDLRSTQQSTSSNSSNLNAKKVVTKSNHESSEPKPSTSGLQNTKLNYSTPQPKAYQTDDSDTSDEEYFKKPKNLNINQYESDDNDESIDVEIVGYVKPRHLRTPEIIELTDDEDEYEKETNKGVKRIKKEENVDDNDDDESKNKTPVEAEVRCRCKVKCKKACKKELSS